MSRIPMIQPDEAQGEVAKLYEAATQLLGRVPNSLRVKANSPHVAKMQLPLTAVLQREGGGSVLSTKIKEMVIIKTSHLNGCDY
ncbi:MAG: hypothetical protein V3U53_04035 [bacterium]